MASTARFDVVAIGNAIVDVIARADDALITAEGLTKGSMRLIDADEAERLYAAMGPAIEMSGGSAANTLAGMAALGQRCSFIGQVADDQLGHVFTHDLRALGVAYETPPLSEGAPTARCLILVTPDGQRTMNTFLGASHLLEQSMIDEAWIADSDILYLEGYLWDPELSRAAMRRAIDVSRAAGRKVAFTLSDAFIIDRHGADFRNLIAEGLFDILFANEVEICALAEHGHARQRVRGRAARHLDRGSHRGIEAFGLRRVDQPHRPLGQPLFGQEVIVGVGDHVHDGVADAEHVEAGGGHAGPSLSGKRRA